MKSRSHYKKQAANPTANHFAKMEVQRLQESNLGGMLNERMEGE